MFLDKRIKFQWLKHLTEKITAVTSLIHVRVCGQPHTAHRAAKVNEIKDLELNFISVFS